MRLFDSGSLNAALFDFGVLPNRLNRPVTQLLACVIGLALTANAQTPARTSKSAPTVPPVASIAQPTTADVSFRGNYAILFCPTYSSPVPPLPGAEADCNQMKELYPKFGYVPLLLTGDNATKMRLQETLRDLKPSAAVILHFSGHGLSVKSRNLLLPSRVQLNELETEGISIEEIVETLNTVAARSAMVIDACRTSLQEASRSRGVSNELFDFTFSAVAARGVDQTNVSILYGSQAGRPAFEKATGGGILTQAFASALKEAGAEGRDVTFKRISDNAVRSASQWVGPAGERQTPALVGSGDLQMGRVVRSVPDSSCAALIPKVCNGSLLAGFQRDLRLTLDWDGSTVVLHQILDQQTRWFGFFRQGKEGDYVGDIVAELDGSSTRTTRAARLKVEGSSLRLRFQTDAETCAPKPTLQSLQGSSKRGRLGHEPPPDSSCLTQLPTEIVVDLVPISRVLPAIPLDAVRSGMRAVPMPPASN